MNIFFLDPKAEAAATMHCDKHVVKMVLETAQLLSTANRILQGDEWCDKKGLYRKTHANHPSAVWCRRSLDAYFWTWRLFKALLSEYTYRYDKEHACGRLLSPLSPLSVLENPSLGRWEAALSDFSAAPQAMPDKYKAPGDPVRAYRAYYLGEKAYFAKWTRRDPPKWWDPPYNTPR